MGSTVAVVPGYLKNHPLFSPYVCEGPEGLEFKTLATEEYDYPSQEWFVKPLELKEGYWSEPYIDEGGGDILMTTYSQSPNQLTTRPKQLSHSQWRLRLDRA